MPSEQAIESANDILRQLERKPDQKGALQPPEASLGSELFNQVESSSLSPNEKQEVYQLVAAGIGEMEMAEAANDPNTFLRGNNARTRFAAEYMNAHAADYNNAVVDVVFEELSKVSFDDPAVAEIGVPKASVELNDNRWKPETIQKSKEQYADFASSVIKATETHMSKLTPDNQKFLQSLVKPAQAANQPDAVNAALSSTLLLRNAQPAILNQCGLLDNDALVKDPELRQKGQFAKSAAGIVMSYANKVNSPPGVGNAGGQGPIVAKLRTEENVARTQAIYAALAESGDALETELQKHGEDEPIKLSPEANQLKQASSGLNEQLKAKEAADIERSKKSRIDKVGDVLRNVGRQVSGAASDVKNAAAAALEKKGGEESLKQLRANNPEAIDEYKDLQKQMSDLKQDYLKAADLSNLEDNTPATIDKIKKDMADVQKKMDDMKAEHKGLAQLDRSKVGQVIHSGVRDAAKAVGSRLKA